MIIITQDSDNLVDIQFFFHVDNLISTQFFLLNKPTQ
jgi:hypothetical protein